jgi:hypothetical protein
MLSYAMLIDHENLAALDVALMSITPDPSGFIRGFNDSHLGNAMVLQCFSFPRDYEEATRELLYERFAGIKHQCDNKYAFKRHIIQEFYDFILSSQSLLRMTVVSPEEIATFHTPKTVVALGQKTLTQIVVENHLKNARPRDHDTCDVPVKRRKLDPASTTVAADPVISVFTAVGPIVSVVEPVEVSIPSVDTEKILREIAEESALLQRNTCACILEMRKNKSPSLEVKRRFKRLIQLKRSANLMEDITPQNEYVIKFETVQHRVNYSLNIITGILSWSVTNKQLTQKRILGKRKTFVLTA